MFEIYTDGACRGNGKETGVGGWGICWEVDGKYEGRCGGARGVTNNIMELTAGLEAMRYAEAKGLKEVTFWSDSQYLVKGLTEWLPGWKRKGWKTAGGKPVLNQELWEALDVLVAALRQAGCQFSWQWVRGHNGHPGNEMADQMANQGADEIMGIAAKPASTEAQYQYGNLVEFQSAQGMWLPAIVLGLAHDDPGHVFLQERFGGKRYSPMAMRFPVERLRASMPRA